MSRILLVEDNIGLRTGMARALREVKYEVVEASDGETALQRLHDGGFDLVLTDMRMGEVSGLDVLRAARRASEMAVVIVMTAYGSVPMAVEAMRAGAHDFLQKPFELAEIESKVKRALEHRHLGQSAQPIPDEPEPAYLDRLVAPGPALQGVLDLIRKVASSNAAVLILGETGTGKELVAGALHCLSDRASGPFVKVNCAAIPDPLLESELFGHERGAFTGADRQRIGRFERAHGGTLFLDEVGDMSPSTQIKLLRVLQEQEFERLGGNRTIKVDVRIVAATNRAPARLIEEGRFRRDLFYRLNVVSVQIPPLRERPEDIVPLAMHFLALYAGRANTPQKRLTADAEALLRRHAWCGNVRELQNAMERLTLLVDAKTIDAEDVRSILMEGAADGPQAWPTDVASASHRPAQPGPEEASCSTGSDSEVLRLDEVERRTILKALERVGWVQKEAAALLGISLRAMNYRIKALGIRHDRWRRNR